MPDVAVLVLNWNGRRWLEPCFAALAQQNIAFEPWLIDNGSDDDSLRLAQARLGSVRTLALGRNLGYGAAYNRAVDHITAPYLALLNNDTVVQHGWLTALVTELELHPEAAAVGSKLLYLDRPEIINHAGGQITPLGAAFDMRLGARDVACDEVARDISCATGAAFLVRRDALLEVGGFDEDYFAYFEDADLCWRFWLRGYVVRYQPAARVLHAYGGSTGRGRFSSFRVQHCQTNRLQNMLKHLEVASLSWAVPASLAYDVLRTAQALRAGRTAEVRALRAGTAAFARLLPRVLYARRGVQRTRKRSDAELRTLGVIASLAEAAREWRRLSRLEMRPPGATGWSRL